MKRSKIKHSRSNQVFYIFNTIFWIIFMFLIIYPLYLVCIASVSDPDAIVAGKVIWHPVDFSLIGYKAVLEYTEFWSSYRNSFIYTISSVVISIIVTLTAAYSLSRPKFPGKAAINMFFVITMFFNGGLIPCDERHRYVQQSAGYDTDGLCISLEFDGGKNLHSDQYPRGIV